MDIRSLNDDMKSNFHKAGYTGKNVIACVLDTAVGNAGWIAGKVEYADSYRIDANNTDDHGSFVSGQIIEWLPDAKILSYCVFPNGNGNLGHTNDALEDVIKRATYDKEHFYVVNMSLACNIGRNVITRSIDKMHKLIKKCNEAGVSVFVAAGNDGTEELYIYPSRFEEPICVGAANRNGTKASFSVFHDELDFLSDGVNVVGMDRFGKKTTMSGTSMACPNALGKSALLACKMKAENGKWPSDEELYAALMSCTIDLNVKGYDKYTGHGFVDIRKYDALNINAEASDNSIVEQFISDNKDLQWGYGLINSQTVYPDKIGTFGTHGSIHNNGCGAIATHNCLRLLQKQSTFEQLILQFNKDETRATINNGKLGSSPFYVASYFRQHQSALTRVTTKDLSKYANKSVFIVLYAWAQSKTVGAHYQAIQLIDGKLHTYNPNKIYDSYEKFIAEEGAITPQLYLVK